MACWIAHLTVDDPDAYEACRQANGPALARYGDRFIVPGGRRRSSRAGCGRAW